MSSVSHAHAVNIELSLRGGLECQRFGFGGIADADMIDGGGAYIAVASALAPLYAIARDNKREMIDAYLFEWRPYSDKRMEEIIDEAGEEWVEEMLGRLHDLLTEER